MKTTLILILLIASHFTLLTVNAQSISDKHSTFHFSFIPPLSTHGSLAAEYTNSISFNMLAGISQNEEAFTFGGLANIIHHNANGFQFAGLGNYAGNNGHGMMFAGLANIVGNRYKGFQFSGLINAAKEMKGFQFGALGNITTQVKGMQFAGLGNIAGDLKGFQFGGLFNIAGNVTGVQFAGLINIAQSSDYPIALLNIIKNGEYALGVTYNEMGSTILALRSGGRVMYGILGIGYNHQTQGSGFTTEGGFGAHINIATWFRINHEIKGGCVNNFSSDDDQSTTYLNYALLPAFRLGSHLELFAGPSLNYLQSKNPDNTRIFPNHSLWKKHGPSKLQQIYIGFQVGMQYIF